MSQLTNGGGYGVMGSVDCVVISHSVRIPSDGPGVARDDSTKSPAHCNRASRSYSDIGIPKNSEYREANSVRSKDCCRL
jgi:hypothetical protein